MSFLLSDVLSLMLFDALYSSDFYDTLPLLPTDMMPVVIDTLPLMVDTLPLLFMTSWLLW